MNASWFSCIFAEIILSTHMPVLCFERSSNILYNCIPMFNPIVAEMSAVSFTSSS